jgi:hypothetical protein
VAKAISLQLSPDSHEVGDYMCWDDEILTDDGRHWLIVYCIDDRGSTGHP